MSTEKLIQALREVLECEREEVEARQRYSDHGGINWDYYKVAEFQAALNEAIDARVRVLAEYAQFARDRARQAM